MYIKCFILAMKWAGTLNAWAWRKHVPESLRKKD